MIALALAGALSPPAQAARVAGAYTGTTDAGRPVSFRVAAAPLATVRGFSIGYVSRCSDGERLRSTFRFYPTTYASDRFAVAGSSDGTLADGRAFTARVRLSGHFVASGAARGTFKLITRIPDRAGALATCSTGIIRWHALRR